MSRIIAAPLLLAAFLRDLVVSSLQVARAVVTPGPGPAPRFVVVPLAGAETDLEITLIANYITLTPGTLTVDLSADRRTLLVHALLAGETGDSIRSDIACIEARILRVTR